MKWSRRVALRAEFLNNYTGFVGNIKENKPITRFKYSRGNIATYFEGMGFKYVEWE